MKKKGVLSILVAVLTAVAAIVMTPIFVQADTNNITASIVDAKEYYDAGDELSLSVILNSFPAEYDTARVRFSYDASKLEYVSATEYGGSMVVTSSSGSQVAVNRGANGAVLTAGKLADIKFRVLSSVSGSANFTFSSVIFENTTDATAPEVNGTYDGTVTIRFSTPLSSISLAADKTAIGVGETTNLTVNYNPSNTTDSKSVTFSSSNPDVATVSSTGVVTGVELGSAVITASSAVPGVDDATITINVTADLTAIEIDPTSAEIKPGETKNLGIIYTPANATDKGTITWSSSDTGVATVDNNGVVTGVAYGTATITASNSLPGIADATATITVAQHVESVIIMNGTTSLAPNETVELNRNNTLTLNTVYSPSSVSDDTAVVWTSTDESVATVSNTGVVTPVAGNKGTTTITASIAGVSASMKVKVIVPVEGLSLPADFNLGLTTERTILAVFTPADADNQSVTWETSDPDIVSVNNEGLVKALAPGVATITAKSVENNAILDTVVVTVPDIDVETVTIDKQDQTIVKGSELELAASYYPENATTARGTTWASSDETVATVDSTGKVTALAAGTTTISATIAGVTGTTTVRVIVPLESIEFSTHEVNLNKGDNMIVGVNVLPVDTTDSNTIVYASESPEIATVNAGNGTITAVKPGDAVITVTKGDKTDYLTVHVKSPLESINVNSTLDLLKNQSKNLQVTYNPTDTTDSHEITWTNSDETVAVIEVVSDGVLKVTGLKEGTATLTASSVVSGVASKTVTVTVTEIHTTGITISNTVDTMLKNDSLVLSVIFTPEDTTDDKTVEWSSSDTEVATVSSTGVVRALKAGTTIIEAKAGNFTDSFELAVEEVPLTGITLEIDKDQISVGDTAQIFLYAVPRNTTDEFTVTFSSSDEEVATVDEFGVVAGKKAGTAVITAVTSTGAKAQIVVTVKAETMSSPETGIFTREQSAVMATSFGLAIVAAGIYMIFRKSARK